MRVRYVSPLLLSHVLVDGILTDGWLWCVCLVVLFGCLVWLLVVFCLGVLCFVWVCCRGFVSRSYPIYCLLHTKDVKLSFCLSEWALDCRWKQMFLVRCVVVSLSVMDCLYPRDPLQPVRKKNISRLVPSIVPTFLVLVFLGEALPPTPSLPTPTSSPSKQIGASPRLPLLSMRICRVLLFYRPNIEPLDTEGERHLSY